jgi:hypothetical protein
MEEMIRLLLLVECIAVLGSFAFWWQLWRGWWFWRFEHRRCVTSVQEVE